MVQRQIAFVHDVDQSVLACVGRRRQTCGLQAQGLEHAAQIAGAIDGAHRARYQAHVSPCDMGHVAVVSALGRQNFARSGRERDRTQRTLPGGSDRSQPQVARLFLQVDQTGGTDVENARCMARGGLGFTLLPDVDAQS